MSHAGNILAVVFPGSAGKVGTARTTLFDRATPGWVDHSIGRRIDADIELIVNSVTIRIIATPMVAGIGPDSRTLLFLAP